MFYEAPGLGDEQKEFLENMYRTTNTLSTYFPAYSPKGFAALTNRCPLVVLVV